MYIKKKRLEETASERETRLQKMREYRKKRKCIETQAEKVTRLESLKTYQHKKRSKKTESERRNRLDALNAYKKKQISEETESETQNRLDAQNAYHLKSISKETDCHRQYRLQRKRQNYKRRKLDKPSNVNETVAQKHYLDVFDSAENGLLHEQSWAKQNISNFHKSILYFVFKCILCHEAWPLKSKPKLQILMYVQDVQGIKNVQNNFHLKMQ